MAEDDPVVIKVDADTSAATAKMLAFSKSIGTMAAGSVKNLSAVGDKLVVVTAKVAKYAAAAAAAAVAVTAGLVVAGIKSARTLQVQADALGISTSALRALQAAADAAGLSHEAIVVGIRNAQKAVGEALNGMIEYQRTFRTLGLEAENLAMLSPDKQFLAIADALARIENPAQQTALAMKLFQEQGFKLLPLIRQQAGGISALVDAYKNMGTELTDAQNRTAALASGGLEDLGLAFGDLTRGLAAGFAPAIIVATNAIKGIIKGLGGMTGVIQKVFEFSKMAGKVLGDAFQGAGIIVDGLALGLVQLGIFGWEGIRGVVKAFTFLAEKVKQVFALIGAESTFVWNGMKSVALVVVEVIVSAFTSGIMSITSFLQTLGNEMTTMRNSTVRALGEELLTLGTNGTGAMLKLGNTMKGEVAEALQATSESAGAVTDAWMALTSSVDTSTPMLDTLIANAEVGADRLKATMSESIADIQVNGTLGDAIVGDLDKTQAQIDALIAMLEEGANRESKILDGKRMRIDQHIAGITQEEQNYNERTVALWESGWQGKLQITQGILGDLAQLQNSESRKAFAIGKAASIANAVIAMYSSAVKSYDSLAGIPYVGPFLGAAAAAAAVAAGVINIQKIRSQSFGGSSSGAPAIPQSRSAGSLGSNAGGGIGTGDTINRTTNANITLIGNAFSADAVRGLIGSLNDQIGDNANLKVS